ncbi:MAG TPA: hypothetical protein VGN34_25095 [Ktedonobacteraceae bacterium]
MGYEASLAVGCIGLPGFITHIFCGKRNRVKRWHATFEGEMTGGGRGLVGAISMLQKRVQ